MSSKPTFFKFVLPKLDPKHPIMPAAEIHARHGDTFQRMTPKLTESQLDGYIDQCIKELEYIRREGKRKFAAAKKKLSAPL